MALRHSAANKSITIQNIVEWDSILARIIMSESIRFRCEALLLYIVALYLVNAAVWQIGAVLMKW